MTYLEYCQALANIRYHAKEYQKRKAEEEMKKNTIKRLHDFKEFRNKNIQKYDVDKDKQMQVGQRK